MLEIGSTSTVKALGRTWTIGRLELRVIREFRDWIKTQIGDPFARVEKFFDRLPDAEKLRRIKEAEDECRQLESFSLSSDLAKRFMNAEEGAAFLFWQLLKPAHPDVTIEEAFQVCQAMGQQRQNEVLAKSAGEVRGNGAAPVVPGQKKSTGTKSIAV